MFRSPAGLQDVHRFGNESYTRLHNEKKSSRPAEPPPPSQFGEYTGYCALILCMIAVSMMYLIRQHFRGYPVFVKNTAHQLQVDRALHTNQACSVRGLIRARLGGSSAVLTWKLVLDSPQRHN